MKLSDARIGYAGYSRDFNVPGDCGALLDGRIWRGHNNRRRSDR
jgi:hypothetical protein